MNIKDIQNLDHYVLSTIIYNKNCPAIVYEAIYELNNRELREKLAQCKYTPSDILKSLYKNYKNEVLENTNCPVDLIENTYNKLVQGSYNYNNMYDDIIRISSNPSTPSHILEDIFNQLDNKKGIYLHLSYRDVHLKIMPNIAGNPNTPKSILDLINNMGYEYTTLALYSNPSFENKISITDIRNLSEGQLTALVKNESTKPKILNEIYRINKIEKIDGYLVRNPNTPFSVIKNYCERKKYSADKILNVLYNPNVPLEFTINYIRASKDLDLLVLLIKKVENVEELLELIIEFNKTKKYQFSQYPDYINIIMAILQCFPPYNKHYISFMHIITNYIYLHEIGIDSSFRSKCFLSYYYLLARYSIFKKRYYENTLTMIEKIDKEIQEGIIPNEVLYYMFRYPSFYSNLSQESINIIRKVYDFSYKNIPGSNVSYKSHYISLMKNQLLDTIEKNTTNPKLVNIKDYIIDKTIKNDNSLVFTAFAEKQNIKRKSALVTYEVEKEKNSIVLKFDTVEIFRDKVKNGYIKAGYFPQIEVSSGESFVLDFLIDEHFIVPSKESMLLDFSIFTSRYNIYIVNGRRFVKYENKWYELLPIKWKINYEENTLVSEKALCDVNGYNSKNVLKFFVKDAIEQYTRDLNLQEDSNANIETNSENILDVLEQKKNETTISSEIAERELNEYRNNVIQILRYERKIAELKVKTAEYETKHNIISNERKIVIERKSVDPNALIIDLGDHKEFNKDFKPFLNQIDLDGISCENLDIRGLDLGNSNLKIDPQLVYNKDLSNAIINGEDLGFWISFAGCNLKGTKILGNKFEATGLEDAEMDDRTSLPKCIDISKLKR